MDARTGEIVSMEYSVGCEVGAAFLDLLKERGFEVPGDDVCRIIVDIGVDEIVKIYYIRHGVKTETDALLEVLKKSKIGVYEIKETKADGV